MKDYKRKAKRVDNGEWITGCLLEIDDGTYRIATSCLEGDSENLLNVCCYEVVPETICDSTGLTDKNGNKIWENDIVTCCEKRGCVFLRCLVLWNQRKARFDVRAMECNFPMILDGYADDISINGLDYEVIGNVFDNKELLKE